MKKYSPIIDPDRKDWIRILTDPLPGFHPRSFWHEICVGNSTLKHPSICYIHQCHDDMLLLTALDRQRLAGQGTCQTKVWSSDLEAEPTETEEQVQLSLRVNHCHRLWALLNALMFLMDCDTDHILLWWGIKTWMKTKQDVLLLKHQNRKEMLVTRVVMPATAGKDQ